MRWSRSLTLVGAHAEGEVGQVVTGGLIDLPGDSMIEKLLYLKERDRSLIELTLFEPRGCAQMTVNLLLPPTRSDAQAAFIPLQPDGPHAMSGSNAICVTTVLLELGILPMSEPETVVALDTAAGLVRAVASCQDGRCRSVALDFPPSFVERLDCPLEIEGYGTHKVDVAFGGCYFVLADARSFGFALAADEARDLVDLGSRIRDAAQEQIPVRHPIVASLDRIEYALFCGWDGSAIRNANLLYPGRIDRSPCGTGTAARLAVMQARGQISVGESIEARSIIDSRFETSITAAVSVGDRQGITARIAGRAWVYAMTNLGVDPGDPFGHGFTLPDTWGEAGPTRGPR